MGSAYREPRHLVDDPATLSTEELKIRIDEAQMICEMLEMQSEFSYACGSGVVRDLVLDVCRKVHGRVQLYENIISKREAPETVDG